MAINQIEMNMNYHYYESELPLIKLNYEEWTAIMKKLLKHIEGTFDFNGFVQKLAQYLINTNTGIPFDSHTSYKPNLQWADIEKIREIIWDFIVLRYITVGGHGTDIWPALTVTQRGEIYLRSI